MPILTGLLRLQMRGLVPHKMLGIVSYIAILLSLAMLAAFSAISFRRGYREYNAFIAFILCSVLLDAVLCASLSGVYNRYQARVTWLIVLAAIVSAFQWSRNFQSSLNSKEIGSK